jgi:imidazolonepropionase-like amidohydrolase
MKSHLFQPVRRRSTRAAVDEATRFGSYVATHCHPGEAVRRSAELGVRSIGHCTLVDRDRVTRSVLRSQVAPNSAHLPVPDAIAEAVGFNAPAGEFLVALLETFAIDETDQNHVPAARGTPPEPRRGRSGNPSRP